LLQGKDLSVMGFGEGAAVMGLLVDGGGSLGSLLGLFLLYICSCTMIRLLCLLLRGSRIFGDSRLFFRWDFGILFFLFIDMGLLFLLLLGLGLWLF